MRAPFSDVTRRDVREVKCQRVCSVSSVRAHRCIDRYDANRLAIGSVSGVNLPEAYLYVGRVRARHDWRERRVPVGEFAAKTVLKKKVKQKLLCLRGRLCRERGGILVYGYRVNAVCIEPGHGCECES